MKKFDPKRFLSLAKAALDTDYCKEADWKSEDLQEIVNDMEEGNQENDNEENKEDDKIEYDYYDVIDAVEQVFYADTTKQLPKAVQDLVLYTYDFAIDHEDSARINDIGAAYYTGSIGVQDFNKANYYYEKAADLGDSYSIENLGYIYYYGRTGEVNYEKAYQQFSKGSAVYNRAISTYKLGDMFKNGYYVHKDVKSAFRCYQRAESLIDNRQVENRASNCAPDIYFRLGECYFKGQGTDVDLDKALRYYQKAECGFIEKVREGDYLVKKMLTTSIDRQEEVRNAIAKDLPEMEWAKKNSGYNTI